MTSELVESVVEDGLEGVSGVALEETKTKRLGNGCFIRDPCFLFFFIPLEMGRMKNHHPIHNQFFCGHCSVGRVEVYIRYLERMDGDTHSHVF